MLFDFRNIFQVKHFLVAHWCVCFPTRQGAPLGTRLGLSHACFPPGPDPGGGKCLRNEGRTELGRHRQLHWQARDTGWGEGQAQGRGRLWQQRAARAEGRWSPPRLGHGMVTGSWAVRDKHWSVGEVRSQGDRTPRKQLQPSFALAGDRWRSELREAGAGGERGKGWAGGIRGDLENQGLGRLQVAEGRPAAAGGRRGSGRGGSGGCMNRSACWSQGLRAWLGLP